MSLNWKECVGERLLKMVVVDTGGYRICQVVDPKVTPADVAEIENADGLPFAQIEWPKPSSSKLE